MIRPSQGLILLTQLRLIPWIRSLTLFFRLVGAGFLGFGLGAGPLPILGNLILHLVYGGVLGRMYAARDLHFSVDDAFSPADRQVNAGAERGIAIGVAAGGAVGIVLALLAGGILPVMGTEAPRMGVMALVGGALDVFIGALVGSFAGLSGQDAR